MRMDAPAAVLASAAILTWARRSGGCDVLRADEVGGLEATDDASRGHRSPVTRRHAQVSLHDTPFRGPPESVIAVADRRRAPVGSPLLRAPRSTRARRFTTAGRSEVSRIERMNRPARRGCQAVGAASALRSARAQLPMIALYVG